MSNYFNDLTLREQLAQLGKCRFMEASEFEDGVTALLGKKIVIVVIIRVHRSRLAQEYDLSRFTSREDRNNRIHLNVSPHNYTSHYR